MNTIYTKRQTSTQYLIFCGSVLSHRQASFSHIQSNLTRHLRFNSGERIQNQNSASRRTGSGRKEIKNLRLQAQKVWEDRRWADPLGHFYRTLFENSGTATIVIEQDTTISMMNNDFANFTGYPREEIIGHTWTTYVAEDDVDRLLSFHKTKRMTVGGGA